ncbi:T6SS immunity protein Tli4 family protein [Pseudomonas viridiflava]|uniref:T6SS immunity protein Tli4 family protein n=2 Tax=Pseudomonas viridiflava TaxID=33069 RepID=UPI001E45B545|nr:T6SS immunity protein Tli4 family protein [Pseudomonas viridiflava]
MKNTRQTKIFCVLSTTCLLTQTVFAQHMESLLRDQWTTHYFGRFKLDLPANSEITADYKIYNEKIELISKNGKSQLEANIANTISKLNTGVTRGKSDTYERTVPLSNGSALVLSQRKDFYTINAYLLTSKNTLYKMDAAAISDQNLDDAISKTRKLSDSIFFRVPQEAPPSGAFSLEAGYTTLPPSYAKESIYMGAQISSHPGTYVSLLTQRIARQEESLIERVKKNQSGLVFEELKSIINQTKTLRKRERMIGDIKAEEIAVRALAEGKRFYDFQVEYKGTLKSNVSPYIALALGTHEEGSDFKTDEEALAFWDRVVDSLKPLP